MLRTMLRSKIHRATVTHLVHPGDLVILIAYATMQDAEARNHRPRVVFVDADNEQIDLGSHSSDLAYVPGEVAELMSPR
jgi:aspartate 1-decarboxylase